MQQTSLKFAVIDTISAAGALGAGCSSNSHTWDYEASTSAGEAATGGRGGSARPGVQAPDAPCALVPAVPRVCDDDDGAGAKVEIC